MVANVVKVSVLNLCFIYLVVTYFFSQPLSLNIIVFSYDGLSLSAARNLQCKLLQPPLVTFLKLGPRVFFIVHKANVTLDRGTMGRGHSISFVANTILRRREEALSS